MVEFTDQVVLRLRLDVTIEAIAIESIHDIHGAAGSDAAAVFGHIQFALICAAVMGTWLAAVHGTAITNGIALGFLSTGTVLLLITAITFGAGRMEVGDEIWHLKRLIPILRPIDQSIPWLILIAAGWVLCISTFKSVPASLGTIRPQMFDSVLLVSIGGFAFLCLFARWATAITVGRQGAGRVTLGVALVLWVVLPVLSLIIISAGALSGGLVYEASAFLGRFSPFYVMAEGIERESYYASVGGVISLPGFAPFVVYLLLAVVFLIVGELMRHRRWKGFDYHYDMPAA